MRLWLAMSVILALAGHAQARDLTLALDWAAGLPGEVVGVLRHADGTILHSQRQIVSGDQTSITLDFVDMPRQAQTVQAALLDGTRLHAQSPLLPLEARSTQIDATLVPMLALSFSGAFDCGQDFGNIELLEAETTARLVLPEGRILDLTVADAGWTSDDGVKAQRRGTRLTLNIPEHADLSCMALPVVPLLPVMAEGVDGTWTIQIDAQDATVTLPEGTLPQGTALSPVDAGQLQGGDILFRSDQFGLRLSQHRCTRPDHLVPYPLRATLTLADTAEGMAGCAGSPLDLLAGREWRVTSVLGIDLTQEMTLAIAGADLSGRGSCNRYLGRLGIDGGRLRVTELGTTRVGCPIAARNLELRFLDALEGADGFSIGANGVLVLRTGVMPVLTAERRP